MGLLNVDGYYNSLLAFMDKAVDEGFVTPAARHIIVSAHTAQDLMCKLEVHFQLFFILIVHYYYQCSIFIFIFIPRTFNTCTSNYRSAHDWGTTHTVCSNYL